MTGTGNQKTLQRIMRGLQAHRPLYYLQGWEEERMEALLSVVAESVFKGQGRFISWSWGGFSDGQTTQTVLEALQRVLQDEGPTLYLFKDLPLWFDDPRVLRKLRDAYYVLRNKPCYLFIGHPQLHLPELLKKTVFLVEMALPSEAEIENRLKHHRPSGQRLNEAALRRMAVAMKGLSLDEVEHLAQRLFAYPQLSDTKALREIMEEKSQLLAKEGVLRFYVPERSLDDIGGLENLKDWVRKRQGLFTEAAFEHALPLPAGVLFMGVSGCGKSLAAKVIAAAWDMPLVRLDMSLVISGRFGPAEYAFDQATRVADAIAPIVLWIDELENAFGLDGKMQGGGNVNIFSSFLTWMQEKNPRVFLAATANRIEQIPAELMRKGRFDQLFFLDLPNKREREQIFQIHIRLQGGDPEHFDIGYLAAATHGWSGAEIESVIKAARIEAWQEGRSFNEQDVIRNTAHMVPLSRTMEEQIKAIRDWSFQRAIPASKKD